MKRDEVMKKPKRRQKALKGMMKLLCMIIVFISSFVLYIDLWKYPEKYLTTWRYQLYNDIVGGDAEAIEYYQRAYIDKGKHLFGEKDDISILLSNRDK